MDKFCISSVGQPINSATAVIWEGELISSDTKDAMEATIEPLPYELLNEITRRITSEVKGVNRVLYDLSPKPFATIEWE